jgi:hypothetical protein
MYWTIRPATWLLSRCWAASKYWRAELTVMYT